MKSHLPLCAPCMLGGLAVLLLVTAGLWDLVSRLRRSGETGV